MAELARKNAAVVVCVALVDCEGGKKWNIGERLCFAPSIAADLERKGIVKALTKPFDPSAKSPVVSLDEYLAEHPELRVKQAHELPRAPGLPILDKDGVVVGATKAVNVGDA